MLETGDAAPHTSVPGRRTLADWFNEAQAKQLGADGSTTSVFRAPQAGASDADHSEPLQRSATSAAIPDSPVAQRVAGEGLAGASASLPHLGTIQESFGRHDVTGVRTQVGGPADAASQAIGAAAYAQGDRVGFGAAPDLHTAAHEAAHVVQQRSGHAPAGGIDTPGDALEKHADAVANAVVAGDSAEALLDSIAGPAAAGSTSAVQRKGKEAPPDPAKVRAMLERYLFDNQTHVWRSIGEHMRAVQFPVPHERLPWRRQDDFVVKMLKQLESSISDFKPLQKLDEVLFPSDTTKTLGALLPSTIGWFPEIGIALAHALNIAAVASLKRLAVRYLELADSRGAPGEDAVQWEELMTSMPIDRYIAVAMCWRGVVTVQPLDPKAAKAAKGKHVGLREITKLTFEGARDRSLWNWVRVEPADATAEEVASKIWTVTDDHGDKKASFNAYLLAAAPPLFGVPKRMAIQNRNFSQYAPPQALDGDDSVDTQLLQIANSTATDVAAHEARTPSDTKPGGAPADLGKVLETIGDCELQVGVIKDKLTVWGLAQQLDGGSAFLKRKRAELANVDAKALADWRGVISGQKDRLTRISGSIVGVTEAAEKMNIKDPRSDDAAPLREILDVLAVAAGVSHLAQPSEAKLQQALQLQGTLSLRALQATERNMMASVAQVQQQKRDDKHIAALNEDALALQRRSRQLQMQMLGGEEVDQEQLEDVSVRSEEIALESQMYGTLDALKDLNSAAREAGKGDAAIIASLFSGKFRDLPALTKHIFDEIAPIRNHLTSVRQTFDEESKTGGGSAGRKAYVREARRKAVFDARTAFERLREQHELKHFFKSAAETIENQQFRTACVKVAAMIGISVVAGAVAGVAARAVGGMLMEASGASAVSELGLTARAGIAVTQAGVDATINAAGSAAIQGQSFTEAWQENLIMSLASSAIFGSFGRYAAEQAQAETKIAKTWASASKLGKLGMVVKEVGAITGHTLWGAAMGAVAGRIVTGKAAPPPETLREWALQGVSVAVGKHISQRLTANSKLYSALEESAENKGRGLVKAAAKLNDLAKRVISGPKPDLALEALNEHDQFLRREVETLDRAIQKTGDPTGELWEKRRALESSVQAIGSQGMLETKFTLIGMEELVPGALWKGSRPQIEEALKQAAADGQTPKILEHDKDSGHWRVKIGGRELSIQEVQSGAKTAHEDRVVLAGSDESLRLMAKIVVPKEGVLDVVVHGTVDDFVVMRNGQEIHLQPREFAAYIKKQGIKFKRIRLLACKSGMHPKGAAQHLANKLGITVEAPTDKVWIHPDGHLTVGPMANRDTGEFIPVKPGPSETRFKKAETPTKDATAARASSSKASGSVEKPKTKALSGDEDEHDELMDGLRGHSDRSYDQGAQHDQEEAPETRAVRPRNRPIVGTVDKPGDVQINEHHVFPQEKRYRKWFTDHGVDVHDFVIDVTPPEHQAQHGGGDWQLARSKVWDGDWQEWNGQIMTRLFEAEADLQATQRNPNAKLNRATIIQIARDLMNDRGLGNYQFHRYSRA